MTEPLIYRHRASLFGDERTLIASGDSITCREGGTTREIPFAAIRRIRIYRAVESRHLPAYWRCIVTPAQGSRLAFTSLHKESKAPLEDRSADMQTFTSEFLVRAARANPAIEFIRGKPLLACFLWIAVFAVLLGFIGLGGYIFVVALLGKQAVISGILGLAAAATLVIASAIPLLRWIKDGWPSRFDPLGSPTSLA